MAAITAEVSLGDLLTILSIVVAVALALLAHRASQRANLREHTVSLLALISSNERLAESDFVMTRLINGDEVIDGSSIDDDTDRHVVNLLDYYEFLAELVHWGAIDRDTVIKVRGGPMTRALRVCERYIADRRESLGAPDLYGDLLELIRGSSSLPSHASSARAADVEQNLTEG